MNIILLGLGNWNILFRLKANITLAHPFLIILTCFLKYSLILIVSLLFDSVFCCLLLFSTTQHICFWSASLSCVRRFYALQQQQTAASSSLASAGAGITSGQALASPVTSHPYCAIVYRSRAYILTLLHRVCIKARAQVSDMLLEVMFFM